MAYTHRTRPFLCSRLVMSNQEQIFGKHITNSLYIYIFISIPNSNTTRIFDCYAAQYIIDILVLVLVHTCSTLRTKTEPMQWYSTIYVWYTVCMCRIARYKYLYIVCTFATEWAQRGWENLVTRRCGGTLVAHHTFVAEVPGSNHYFCVRKRS